MSHITYTTGDATAPAGAGCKIICHICNDIGGWGKGFVVAISKRWPEAEAAYRKWHEGGKEAGFELGAVQFVRVSDDTWVANMIGQRDIKSRDGVPPIRYDAVEACLTKVAAKAKELDASAHMPRIGCGLAGGEWSEIEPIIERTLIAAGVSVTVYDFKPAT